MALTPAEKQKRYRERVNADPEKRAKYLKKMRETAQKRRDLKIDKSISDLSEREQRQKRKEWKERQRKSRQRRKQQRQVLERTLAITPPNTLPPLNNEAQPANVLRGRKKKEKMDIAKEKQEDNKLFKCKKCSKSYKRKITVENHTKHGCKGDGIWADESEEQPRIPKASKTPKKKNAQKSKTNADKNNAEKEKIFTCKKCNKSYGNKITILRHRYRGCPKQWIWVGPSSPLWKARR